ncbi:colicin E3-like toxin immunity protein [Pseudomonas sp. FP198]|uniref:colicin E3-like toxin immunity protein n=1 Tax=Pseudomonas sp. FP198 TaxID=2954084 RepID=UPI0027346AE3|nr:colicin E3-like toxin immunity protein [Pseudomonas sp. FP198]WLG95571.1 colicin E3-like toxin immunity protein [Pseudomonas sp. FP198]
MGLQIRLRWFDKTSQLLIGKEYSKDFADDSSVMDDLDIPLEKNINNGNFDVNADWVEVLQPHFRHALDLSKHDYQISFDYQNA